MAKKIELIHAEIIKPRSGKDIMMEFNNDDGSATLIWNVKTKLNDKVERCPVVFDTCSCYVKTSEQKDNIKSMIREGSIVNIKGYADRKKSKKTDDNGNPIYYDQVHVKEITEITGNDADDNLPF